MKSIMIILLTVMLSATASLAMAGTADVTFTPPTERADGSALLPSEIGGYNVYVDGVLDATVSPLPAASVSFSLTRPSGTYTVIMTTFDTANRVSVDSVGAAMDIPFAIPNAPTGIIITIR